MTEGICEKRIFEKVYREQVDPLRNFLYYKCGSLQLAEDLAHDSFSKLWENCAKIVFDKAKSFVFTIANNLFLNHIKHQKVVLNFEKKSGSVEDKKDPHYLLEENEFKEKLEKAISDLPETQRVVFLMNRIDQLTYKEIAKTLDVSVKAVEKRMHKALKKLKQIYIKI